MAIKKGYQWARNEEEATERFLASIPIEWRLRGLTPEQLLAGLTPEQRLAAILARLKALPPEQLQEIVNELERRRAAKGR